MHVQITIGLLLSVIFALTGASSLTLSGADQDYIVQLHNEARDLESAQNMQYVEWDTTLASEAQTWTDACEFKHGRGDWGENLSAGSYSTSRTMNENLDRLFTLWTNEKQFNPGGTYVECCSSTIAKCCHYTQVIWAKTTKVGCGFTLCPTLAASWGAMQNMLYMACFYTPKGNKPEISYTFDWRPFLPMD